MGRLEGRMNAEVCELFGREGTVHCVQFEYKDIGQSHLKGIYMKLSKGSKGQFGKCWHQLILILLEK